MPNSDRASPYQDTRPATWAHMLPRLRRDIEELRGYGCEVIEPPEFEKHPDFRSRQTS